MGLDVCTIPALDVEELKKDESLTVENGMITYDGSSIAMYDENAQVEDYFRVWSGSEKVLKYLAEKYDLLIGADGFLNDAGHQTHLDADDRARLAIEEMLAYKDVYGWSEEFVAKLEKRTT